MRSYILSTILAMGLVFAVAGCGGPEERKASYLAKAQAYSVYHDSSLLNNLKDEIDETENRVLAEQFASVTANQIVSVHASAFS